MVAYNLSHLTQDNTQPAYGPIQDDEALALFAVIRTMRLRRILEVGGQTGYSAANFLQAVNGDGTVYTVDVNPVTVLAKNHRVIVRDARQITGSDVDNLPLDMLFFDCHVYDAQMTLFVRLRDSAIITDHTVIALHDTNLHPGQFAAHSYAIEGGFVHQDVERRMVNDFKRMGYDCFSLHTRPSIHDERLPFRHGLTICQHFSPLAV